jgi:1-acyl-sn-glycerol-3-phosphate acyltransferase
MLRPFYQFLFRIFGWKINGGFPAGLKKYIIAIAPHTSNWDFIVGVAARSVLRITDAKFLAKSQLFKPPFGWIFRALGGYPVDRSSSHDMVTQAVDIVNSHTDFILAITPEGTRKKVQKLKTGFYYIAKGANIPIIPVGFDYEQKQVVVGEPLYPGQMEEDFQALYQFYKSIKGKNPELGLNDVIT